MTSLFYPKYIIIFIMIIIIIIMLFLCRLGYIQASRALMITAVVLGTFGLVSGLIGMQCSKAGGDNLTLKGKIAGTGGVMFILQGKGKRIKIEIRKVSSPSTVSEWLKVVCLVFGPNAGLCTMIAVSWYAFNITQDFFDPFYPGIKWDRGTQGWNNRSAGRVT